MACFTNSLFLASYPFRRMSLVELRRAALAPTLWRNRIHRGVIDDLDEFYTSITSSFPNEDAPPGPGPLYTSHSYTKGDAFLVPGGRFFISYRDGHIHLYDIRPVGAPNRVFQPPIVSRKVNMQLDHTLMQLPMFVVPIDETRFRAVVSFIMDATLEAAYVRMDSRLW